MQSQSSGCYQAMPQLGIIFGGMSAHFTAKYRVLKASGRPLSSIESFAMEFVPKFGDSSLESSIDKVANENRVTDASGSMPSEVPSVSVHALDVIADINVEKNPDIAKKCLRALADTYDTMRKGYWEFRLEKLG